MTVRRIALLVAGVLVVALMPLGGAAHATPFPTGGDTLVSVASPPGPFSQNKQNEPAVAMDAHDPLVLAAGSNDEIDEEACNAGDPTVCPFTDGVGVSGIYFSFDGGDSWTQPTYSGWTARNCLGPDECSPEVGPIGTVPNYYENGLASDGDPALAFGPAPGGNGKFDWANGSRLYYVNLTSNFPGQQAFKGFEAIGVSRTDDPQAAAAGDQSAWLDPVIASKQNSALFSDKEQAWADNASSSRFFGNVYICYAAFRGVPGHSQTIKVARSADGGDTWQEKQVAQASNNGQHFGRSGCTVRTDSKGVVYVFYEEFGTFTPEGQVGYQMMVKSTDGGSKWTRPATVATVVQPGVLDEALGRPVMDGIAGFRVDLAGSPSVDIANGAPDGTGATDEIVMVWADARDGRDNEHAEFTYSTDGGSTWADQVAIESSPGDRPAYAAPAISPDGTDVYVVYDAVTNPFRDNTTDPRGLQAVVLHSDLGSNGAPVGFTEIHRGAQGDPRGTSQNGLTAEFLGDYVYAAASRDFGVAVWTDARNAAVCDAVQDFRAAVEAGESATRPAVEQECPATFGNSDIYGGSYADPT